ncbi:MAG: hypothetical protein KY460_08665 [Actinobacteria bacterium]|nr:hypothetical protein [Actinomycetota bacterium]
MSVSIRVLSVAAIVLGVIVGVVATSLDVSGVSSGAPSAAPSAGQSPAPSAAVPATLEDRVTKVAAGTRTSEASSIVARAPTVVLATHGAPRLPAAELALRLRVPLILAAPAGPAPSDAASDGAADGAMSTIRGLGVERAIVVGSDDVADVARDSGVDDITRVDVPPAYRSRARTLIRAAARDAADALPLAGFDDAAIDDLIADPPPAAPATRTAVLVRPRDAAALPLVVAAHAVGHAVVPTRADDLRADRRVVDRLSELGDRDRPPRIVLGGPRMADLEPQRVTAHLPTLASGRQLPGGGQLVIDPARPHARRYIGLYGVPSSPALGVLGEQPVEASVTRAKRLARQYRQVTDDDITILPCFEIIATVASASAGPDGNYANELAVAELEPAVAAAHEAGVYVLLDIQPGRTDFLTLARRYRRLLRQPHVGLALDPEWRLRPNEKHLRQIGSVGIAEVNEVADWLANLVERNDLPQKMLLIHQFRLSMVRDRADLDTSRDELAYVVQMDGQGPQGTKLETWRSITATPPPGVQFGWKNFYDEDSPVRTPADTMALSPPPVFVSYQ